MTSSSRHGNTAQPSATCGCRLSLRSAAVGGTPVRADQIQSSWYGAAGANISIPVFNGFLYNARKKEAKLRAQAAQEDVRNLRD